ncbi:RNA polymerase sigma factor [Motiliproteus coralliicola]|uniref:RNA polymerase sigma factor n=1 Tax=Motiliproteus coralliicola TaxID=2283196 RepID=A0A369WSE7_9GAMM|nr:RNA polymerase sigma factor [Motiliproteus coralliicola]RDE24481.1 RNA polymerase sigma factor [Motiliproteus coralliicola]
MSDNNSPKPYQLLEAELLPKLRQGDKQSLNRLVEAYYGPMRALARSIVGDSIADEVVQEAWFSVYKALPKFEGRSSLKTWILRITANEAKTRLRRESRQVSLEAISGGETDLLPGRFQDDGHWAVPPSSWHDESPDALLTNQEMGDCIEWTLGRLPENQQAVFKLKELEDHSFDEICNILEISASNARVLLHRARVSLYGKIEHFQESGEC